MTRQEYWQSKTDSHLSEAASHLAQCGEEDKSVIRAELRRRGMVEPPPTHRRMKSVEHQADRLPAFIGLGFVAGAVVGFLMRPSAFLIGQLPFATVISRGSNLSGLDQLLVPTAQASFNQMLFFAVIGAAIGFGVAVALNRSNAARGVIAMASFESVELSPMVISADAETLNNDSILNMIASGLGDDVLLVKMRRSKCSFALSSSDLAHLKHNGVSDRIIAAMLEQQASPETSG